TTALVTTAESAVLVFQGLGDDLGLARAWRRLGLVAHTEHRYGDATTAFERALAHAEASGDEQERARSADALCTALLYGPAGDAAAAVKVLRDGYEVLAAGGHESLRAYQAGVLAFVLATEGEAAAAQRFVVACAPGLIAGAHDTAARLRAAQALLVDHRLDGERLAREAVELSERTDDLNLQAAMHLTLARISGDADEATEAPRLYERKGNVAAAAAAARVIVAAT